MNKWAVGMTLLALMAGGCSRARMSGVGGESLYVPWTRFEVQYRVQDSVTAVECFASTDGGRTWSRLARDADTESPLIVTVEGEGEYALRMEATNREDGVVPPPARRARPEMRVVVDQTPPKVTWIHPGEPTTVEGKTLPLAWETADLYMSRTPVTLEYSVDGETWEAIRVGLKPRGEYRWTLPEGLEGPVRLRLTAADLAGNRTTSECPHEVVRVFSDDAPEAEPDVSDVEPFDDEEIIEEVWKEMDEAPPPPPADDDRDDKPDETAEAEEAHTPNEEEMEPAPAPEDGPPPPPPSLIEEPTPDVETPEAMETEEPADAPEENPDAAADPAPPGPEAKRPPAIPEDIPPSVPADEADTPEPIRAPVPESGPSATITQARAVRDNRWEVVYETTGTPQRITLFVTTDGGQTWERYGDDVDLKSPVLFTPPLTKRPVGLMLKVSDRAGGRIRMPRAGEQPAFHLTVVR